MDIYCATKSGDFSRVKYLVEVEDANLNKKDQWDSIPLFYACLCGHKDLVIYLLDQGTRLEPGTFEGERCYYAALTTEIHEILRTYKAKPKHNPLADKLLKILKDGLFSDITFNIPNHAPKYFLESEKKLSRKSKDKGKEKDQSSSNSINNNNFNNNNSSSNTNHLKLNKYVLAARCPYLRDMLETKWTGKSIINLPNQLIYYEAFYAFIEYLYTNVLNIPLSLADNVNLICKQCKMNELAQKIYVEVESASITGIERITIGNESETLNLENTLSQQIRKCLDVNGGLYPDVCLKVEDQLFLAHRSLLVVQSPYFSVMFEGKFKESHSENLSPISLEDVSALSFVYVLEYIYSCKISEVPYELLGEVLAAGDHFLMPSLKNLVVLQITKLVVNENVVDLLILGETFCSLRLQDYCVDFIVENLRWLKGDPDLIRYLFGEEKEGDKWVKGPNFNVLGNNNNVIHLKEVIKDLWGDEWEAILKTPYNEEDEEQDEIEYITEGEQGESETESENDNFDLSFANIRSRPVAQHHWKQWYQRRVRGNQLRLSNHISRTNTENGYLLCDKVWGFLASQVSRGSRRCEFE
eukprot:TRINITY_DN6488_c0_g1_i2.p1 TRINITY_DN6488_c0_g1~~TRINITY_DN6488_c0_g1_i2.p1  ORF type:complete len:583 (+),score=116.64 TRINITY_DN6488_c0_g1_i2:109-1857(+)